MIGVAEPRHRQLAQARLHRRADDQRAGQHRHRDRHAGDDGQVGAPVVAQATQGQRRRRHASFPSTSRNCRPQRAASSGLWVTIDRDGLQLCVQLEEQRRHALRRLAIEVAGRLVAEHQRRLAHQRPRDRHALLLAAGQLRRRMIEPLRQPDAIEQRARAIDVVLRRAGDDRRRQRVLEHGALRQQAVILEDEADAPIAERGQRLGVERVRVDAAERDACRRSVDRGRRRCRAACSCRCPRRRRSTPTRRASASSDTSRRTSSRAGGWPLAEGGPSKDFERCSTRSTRPLRFRLRGSRRDSAASRFGGRAGARDLAQHGLEALRRVLHAVLRAHLAGAVAAERDAAPPVLEQLPDAFGERVRHRRASPAGRRRSSAPSR